MSAPPQIESLREETVHIMRPDRALEPVQKEQMRSPFFTAEMVNLDFVIVGRCPGLPRERQIAAVASQLAPNRLQMTPRQPPSGRVDSRRFHETIGAAVWKF